jgi:hypothetical protein
MSLAPKWAKKSAILGLKIAILQAEMLAEMESAAGSGNRSQRYAEINNLAEEIAEIEQMRD